MAKTSEASKAIRETLASFVGMDNVATTPSEHRHQAIDLEMALLIKLGKIRLS